MPVIGGERLQRPASILRHATIGGAVLTLVGLALVGTARGRRGLGYVR